MVVPTSSGNDGGRDYSPRTMGKTLDDQASSTRSNYCANVKNWVGRWNEMPFRFTLL